MAIIQIDTTHAHTKSLSQILSEKYLEASDYKNNEEILHIFLTESSMSLTKERLIHKERHKIQYKTQTKTQENKWIETCSNSINTYTHKFTRDMLE